MPWRYPTSPIKYISSSYVFIFAFSRECGAICCNSYTRRFCYFRCRTDYTDLRSTTPTQEQVLVPETLLKKRKSQEQARAVRREELEKKKKVGFLSSPILFPFCPSVYVEWWKSTLMMYTTHYATRPQVNAVAFLLTIFRG